MNIDDQPKIRVVVRKRPMNRKEISRCQQDVIDVRNGSSVIVRQMKQKVDLTKYIDQHHFNFDRAFGQTSNNEEVYEDCVKPIVHCAFLGAKVTCFAYGQTGSGKTYTMNGDRSEKVVGLYVLGAKDIFGIRDREFPGLSVAISFYEIYCGKLFDLLNNREQLQARQDAKQNVNIIGLTERKINNVFDFNSVIEEGTNLRITSQNSTNSDSSRSHAILSISLLDGKKVFGKLSFIDLAGCERGADTIDMNKQTRLDGAEINKSLLALKQCIRALDNGKAHTPFRGSKLTMVLKDSLTGFCRTVMIGNISPNSGSCENTLNTLRYADRVKELKKPGSESVSKEDQLAKELMLPRMLKNRQTVELQGSDDDDGPKITYVGAKIKEAEMKKDGQFIHQNMIISQNPYQQTQQNQNRKKSVVKDWKQDGSMSRVKQEKRGFSANPKQMIAKQPKYPNNKPTMSASITDFAHPGQFPKQPKILQQQKGNSNQYQRQHSNSQMFNREQIKTEVYHNNNNNTNNNFRLFTAAKPQLLVTQPLRHKLISNSKKPTTASSLFKKQPSPTLLQTSDYSEWQRRLQQFRAWQPQTQDEVHHMSQKFQSLVNLIMRQQQQVLDLHKNQMDINTEIQEQENKLYQNIIQEDNTNQQFLSYAQNLEQLVEMKISSLVNLKTKLTSYRYHLTEHEICQKKLIKANQNFMKFHEDSGQLILNNEYLNSPPITLSLPDLPHLSTRLFQNSSQYNITQSIKNDRDYDEFLSNYNSNNLSSNYHSNVTNKPNKGTESRIETKRENYGKGREQAVMSRGSYQIGMDTERQEEENDCF